MSRKLLVGSSTLLLLLAGLFGMIVWLLSAREAATFRVSARDRIVERLSFTTAAVHAREVGRVATPPGPDGFLIRDGVILRPRRVAEAAPGLPDIAAGPGARFTRRVDRIHDLRRRGAWDDCLGELDRLLGEDLSRGERIEGSVLQGAVVRAALREEVSLDPHWAERAVDSLSVFPDHGPGLEPAQLRSAKLMLAELLALRGEMRRAVAVLHGMIRELSSAGPYFAGGSTYFREEARTRLAGWSREGLLTPDEEARRRIVEERLVGLAREESWRDELERVWLPRLPVGSRLAGEEGFLYERIGGEKKILVLGRSGTEELVGRLVDSAELARGLVEGLGADLRADGVEPVLVDERSEPLGGSRPDGDPSPDGVFPLPDALGLPWSLHVDLDRASASFLRRRMVLYGTTASLVWLALVGAAVATLRGIAQRVRLAEARSHFVANVTHELKTPLTLIRMFSDLLTQGYTRNEEEGKRSLAVIQREADVLTHMIDNVLDVSRIDGGEKSYRKADEAPGPLSRAVCEEYRPFLEKKGFTLEVEIEDDLPDLLLDGEAFARAMRNLLSNAVKYSRDRREILVRVQRAKGGVEFVVADRGLGLVPGEEKRIFERFVRGESHAGEARAGAGIGLAIVSHFVEAHSGSIEAHRREGGGSEFRMWLPATEGRVG